MKPASIYNASLQIPVLAAGIGWLAVDKPAGTTVHNELGNDLCSLLLTMIDQDQALSKLIDGDRDFGIHPVHRIDKETSGLILLAANREMFRFFSRQFESRQVKKQYIAILHGRLETPAENEWGSWQWPLAKTAGGRKNPQGPVPRQPCETRFIPLVHSVHYTMAAIEILTGRIHQIRRHAKLAGHPVIGDARYGSTRAVKYFQQHHGFDRLGLHSKALTLYFPGEKKSKTIQTAEIPKQMQDLIEYDDAHKEQSNEITPSD